MTDNVQTQSSEETTEQTVQARSIFMVETGHLGVEVTPALFVEEKEIVKANGLVFPTRDYAMAQIDALRALVNQHFDKAAQVGAQVIAAMNEKTVADKAAEPSVEKAE